MATTKNPWSQPFLFNSGKSNTQGGIGGFTLKPQQSDTWQDANGQWQIGTRPNTPVAATTPATAKISQQAPAAPKPSQPTYAPLPGAPTTYPGQGGAASGALSGLNSKDAAYANQLDKIDLQGKRNAEDLATYLSQWDAMRGQGLQDYNASKDQIAQEKERLQSSTNQQREYANADYGSFLNQLNSTFGRQRTDLGEQNTTAQRQLSGNYSARGLSDSSFSDTAQANRATQYQTTLDRLSADEGFQKTQAETTFKRNIKNLDEGEKQKLQDLDTFLKQQETAYERQLQSSDWQKAATSTDAKRKLDDLQSAKDEIKKARAELHANTNAYISGLSTTGQGSVNTANAAKASQEFISNVSQLANLSAPPQQKQGFLQQLVGTYYKPGTPEHDHALNWYSDWVTANDLLKNDPSQKDAVNQQFQQKYGTSVF